MIQPTSYIVNKKIIEEIAEIETSGKLLLNEPTGNFFYDPWKIKEEFQETVFDELLKTLPFPIGEARLITLESGTCYFAHSDIDDRYHLNISGDCAALINLETKQTWFLTNDGIWYDMDAGPIHSAMSFGQFNRKQIVVRKLLKQNTLNDSCSVKIIPNGKNPRFVFDNSISPWLNRANKNQIITNFSTNGLAVTFDLEKSYINNLKEILPKDFIYTIS
jgi:hypothetical protein